MVSAPPIQLTAPPKPPSEVCDLVLGAFMRAWDQHEMAMLALFASLLDATPQTAHIIFNSGWDGNTRRKVIIALSKERCTKEVQGKVAHFLRRSKLLTTKRNRIVHGRWKLQIKVFRDTTQKIRAVKGTWMRSYEQSDLTTQLEYLQNPKKAAQFEYSVPTLVNVIKATRELAKEAQAYSATITLLPYVPPTPLDIS